MNFFILLFPILSVFSNLAGSLYLNLLNHRYIEKLYKAVPYILTLRLKVKLGHTRSYAQCPHSVLTASTVSAHLL